MLKRAISIAAAAIAGVAAAVFLFIPMDTFYQVLVCLIAAGAAVGCLNLWSELNNGGSGPYALWPPGQKKK
jgi:hypothetical protein